MLPKISWYFLDLDITVFGSRAKILNFLILVVFISNYPLEDDIDERHLGYRKTIG